MDQSVGIARMQAYRRLVEDIQRAHKTASQRGAEVDALALTTTERVRETVEGEIAQTYIQQELDARADLRQQAFGHLRIMVVELQVVEPCLQSDHGHLHQVGDAVAVDLHIFCLGLQSGAVTDGTGGLATIPGHHHPILYLVLVVLHHFEELVDTGLLFLAFVRGQPVPEPVFLLARQVHVGLEDGKVVLSRMPAEPLLPLLHLLTVPAHHAPVVHAEGGIGNYQSLVDADHTAKALTLRTGTCRGVEGEEDIRRLLEGDAVGLEAL